MPERGTQTITIPDNPTGSPFFDRLPRELRNEIYELTYAADRTDVIQINTLSGVIESEWSNRIGLHNGWAIPTQTPFLSSDQLVKPLIPQFLVNKQFYHEAIQEYFRTLVLDQTSFTTYDTTRSFHATTLLQNLNALQMDWLTAKLSHDPSDNGPDEFWRMYGGGSVSVGQKFADLWKYEKLETLRIFVSESIFKRFVDRVPCLHTYSDRDFDRFLDLHALARVKTLKRVVLMPMPSHLAKTSQEQEVLRRNFEALQGFVDRMVKEKEKDREILRWVDGDGDGDGDEDAELELRRSLSRLSELEEVVDWDSWSQAGRESLRDASAWGIGPVTTTAWKKREEANPENPTTWLLKLSGWLEEYRMLLFCVVAVLSAMSCVLFFLLVTLFAALLWAKLGMASI